MPPPVRVIGHPLLSICSALALAFAACGIESAGGEDTAGERECGTPGKIDRASDSSFHTLEGCTVHLGKGITVSSRDDLVRLEKLREVSGNLNVSYCLELLSLRGLERLEHVGQLGIDHNPVLLNVGALKSLRTVDGALALFTLESLPSLRGLENLESVAGVVILSELAALESLAGLEGLVSVGSLEITGNARLRSLDGLAQLKTISQDVIITNNPLLSRTQLDAFLTRVQVGGSITVEHNAP